MWIVKDVEGNTLPHADYPHMGDGDLYDCPACEVIMDEEDKCPACGELPDYCQGHGPIGDPVGYATMLSHIDG